MKYLIPALAVAALAGGCAVYDDGYAVNSTTPYYVAGTTYYSNGPVYNATPVYGATYVAPARVQRVDPNDRDGDGVPNWRDRDPNDWRYR